jgi:hypothetical protein
MRERRLRKDAVTPRAEPTGWFTERPVALIA